MPMDYDDNEFSIHNVELTEEGNSTVSPVLRPYDFEDGGHISFDSLVENEVFLGITGQEDNQWIEEYSHGTSSSVVESRRDNVWSEAASSESVDMLLKSVGQETLVTESSDEPGCLATNIDPNLKQDDESNHSQEAMVTDKEEEGALATEELDVSDELCCLTTNMDPNLKQDDESNHSEEAMVTDKEEEGALATEELDVSDEPCCLATNMDPNLKQDDESNHSQEAMVIDKEEEGALATEEMDVSGEPFSLSINLDPSLNQEDENKHTQEAMATNKEEVGALATEKMDASDEPGSLAISMDPNLKQDDGDISAQEAVVTNKEVGPFVTEELDPSDDPCSLNTNVDPNLKQDDGNNHAHETMIINKPQDHFFGSNVNFNRDKFYGTITKNSQEEVKVSCGELDSDVMGNKCDLSEEIVDGICDDVNHEVRNIAIVSSENNLLEDLSTSEIECGNLDASKECNLKKCSSSNEPECSTKNIDNSIGSQTAVEISSNSDEKPSNVESLDKPPFAVDIPIDEESKSAGSCNLLTTESCAEVSHDSKCADGAFPTALEVNNDLMHEHLPPVAVEDDDTPKSENLASIKSNVCSLSKVLDVQSWYVEVSEKPDSVFDPSEMCEGSSINDVGTEMANMCSSPEMITGNTDLVATPKVHSENSNKDQSPAAKLSGSVPQQVNDERQSSEQDGGMYIDHNITLHKEVNAMLPLPLDMDIASHDSQHNVESVSSPEGCKAQGSEADITILAEPGCIDAKSPPIIGRASSVNHDDEEIKEEGFVSDGTCEYESLKVASSMLDCASVSVVETGASPNSVGEGVHGTSVENMNGIMSDVAEEANPDGLGSCSTLSTIDPIPCDSSAKVGDNVEAGGSMQESIPGNDVNMSIEQHASTDAISMDPNLKQDDGDISAQEAVVTNKEVGPFVTEELDPSDDPCSLSTNVDPNLKQDDGNNHSHETMIINKSQDHFSGSSVNLNCDKLYGTITKNSQEEVKVSCGELDSDVMGNKCDLSEEIVDGICNDVNHEARNIAIVSSENNLQEDLSTSEIECGNLDASNEYSLKKCSSSNEPECSTKNIDNSIGSQTAVEICSNSDEKPSNVESLDKPPFAVDIPIDEESKSAGSCNLLTTESCAEVSQDSKCADSDFPTAHELNNDLMHEHLPPVAVEDDDKPKSENLASIKSNVCSPSKVLDVQSWYVEVSEKPDNVFDPSEMCEGSNINDVGTEMTNMCSSPELITGNTDLVATPKVHSENSNKDQSPAAKPPQQVNDERQSTEPDGGMCIDHNITLHKEVNARLSLPLDMDIAAHDSQKNVESVSSAEGCKAQGSEADITILAEPGCIDAKSPPIIGRASSVNHDDEEIKEEGFVSDRTCEYESLKVASSMVDCASLSVVETGASPNSVGEGVHGTSVENMNGIMSDLAEEANPDGLGSCSTLSTVDPIPCDSSAKAGDNVEAGGGMQESIPGNHVNMSIEQHASVDKLQSVSLIDTNNTELSQSTRVKSGDSIINENTQLPEAADAVGISECDDSHVRPEEDSCVSMDKLQSVSLLNTNNNELSQSERLKANEGAIDESASLPEATEDVQGKEQSISSKSDLKIDESFTFEVTGTAGLRETCKGLQLFPASQACNLSTTTEVHCIDSSSSTLDSRKLNEALVVTPQTPGSGTLFTGGKERKTRRKSVGKESVRKGKETTTTRSRRVEKSSPLSVTPPQPPAAGHDIQFQELGPKEKVECTVTKSIPISNLPDLNSATCTFHQPFTDNQQVQLRAQILVYGSLISGMSPEEPHMIAAFGQSDAGRKTWEDAWHACLERVNGQKSHASTPAVQQPRSDLKDLGHISPDLGIKHSSTLSSINKGSPPAVSPLIPVPSPLWNMSTPSCVGFQSRSAAFQQSFTPIHPPSYQTPPNPLWLSQSPFFGQWGVASSPGSSFPRFSGLPITEAVKLTPVNFSGGGPHAYSIPVVHTALFSSQSTDGKKAPSESKSRKRKKVTAAVSSVPSQVLMTPPSAHPVPHTGGHNRIPFLLENRADSVTAPVVTSIFSTSVTVSTPPASTSSSPGRFLSVHDRPRLGDKTVGNAEDMLKKVEQGYVQEADVNATKTWQTSSDSRSIKRTKLTASAAVNQAPVSTQAPPAVACLPQVIGHEISLLAQNQTVSVTAPAFYTSFPTSVAMSTPVSITSDSSPAGKFPETIYPTVSTHGYPRTGYQNMENALAEDTLSKVEESKLQAENAALLAAAEVGNCQDVWSGLDGQNNTGVVSNAEAKLMSSIAAAATVAKMASAAAKIALNVAEQARVMADEVSQSNKTENFGHISHPNVVNKATPASVLKSVDKTTDNHPNSIISAAREAARRRIEAASAASKHAENLDAIVKAAELAAESVSQMGKIIAMGDSSALRKLAQAGPEGFWKISQLAYEQHQGGEISGLHLNSNSGKKNAPDVFIEEIQTLKHGQASPVHLAHNQMKTVIDGGSVTINEKDTRTYKAPKLSKAVGVSTATNSGSPHSYVVGHCIPQNTPAIWDKYNIKEGCLVEVYKKDGKYKGAWLAANVLSLKDEKALVCYTEIQSSDEGSENVKEWVALEVEGIEEVPRIRIAHPMTTMRFEGARKRRRTAVTDYDWSKGDRVDVWMQDCWREGIVVEPNKIDVTTLTVQFPVQGETSVVRSWHVRPTLIWKDRKWLEWNGGCASQGEIPNEKRMRLGSPAVVNDKRKDKLPMIVESGRHEEQGTLLPLLSAKESCFNVGKSTDKPSINLRTIQKERARVVFGVPKPGKKQKFMAVSTQYVDRSNKNTPTNGSLKFSKPPAARGSKNDATENQATETKSRVTSRKPPVPWFRTTTSRDSEPTDTDSVENSSSRSNQTQVGPSSNKRRDPAKGPPPKKAFTFTSKPKSEQFNRGRLQVAPKIEVKEESISQVNEPRRSNRKIQPTSRLLEGIQSSLTISKIPSVSHAGQRRAASKGKGSTSHGPS